MNTLVLTLHILGAGFLLAILILAVLFAIQKPFVKERLSSLRMVINVGAGAAVWQIITGSLLFSERPQDFKSNILFWVKIGLFILDLILGLVLVNRKLKAVEKGEPSQIASSASLIAWTAVNLILTLVIIVISVLVARH